MNRYAASPDQSAASKRTEKPQCANHSHRHEKYLCQVPHAAFGMTKLDKLVATMPTSPTMFRVQRVKLIYSMAVPPLNKLLLNF